MSKIESKNHQNFDCGKITTDDLNLIVHKLITLTGNEEQKFEKLKPLSLDDAKKIKNWGEHLFAISAILANMIVFREPCIFPGENNKSTKPDFWVFNPNLLPDTNGVAIEVTKSPDLFANQNKGKQLRIMRRIKQINPAIKYLQFNGAVMKNLQKHLREQGIEVEDVKIKPDAKTQCRSNQVLTSVDRDALKTKEIELTQ